MQIGVPARGCVVGDSSPCARSSALGPASSVGRERGRGDEGPVGGHPRRATAAMHVVRGLDAAVAADGQRASAAISTRCSPTSRTSPSTLLGDQRPAAARSSGRSTPSTSSRRGRSSTGAGVTVAVDRHRRARHARGSRRFGAARHRPRGRRRELRPRAQRRGRPRRSRHARRRHHRRAPQQRRRDRGRRARREDHAGPRARRDGQRLVVRRRDGHHLGRRPRRAGHQPEPRRRTVAGHADRDPVRALEAGRDVRRGGELVPGRQPADVPGRVSRSGRGRPRSTARSTTPRSRTPVRTSTWSAPGDLIWSTYGQGTRSTR